METTAKVPGLGASPALARQLPPRAASGQPIGERPVFLHTGWRSAGTWLWSHFRALPGVMAYYEPLHPLLAGRRRALQRAHPDAWASGHPDMDAPYFQEYLPLLRRHWLRLRRWGRAEGVRHYSQAFETDRFNAVPPDAEALGHYLDHLLRHARRRRRTPVLKFCRSMGRMAWMMQRYPEAVHVAVLRHPIDQYASMRTQMLRHDNPGFFDMGLQVLCANRGVPRVARVLSALDCALPARMDGPGQVRARSASAHYRAFLALWLLQVLAVPPQVAAVVDSDAMGLDAAYNRRTSEALARLTGLAPDLGDARARPLPLSPGNCEAELGLPWVELAGLHAKAWALARHETAGNDGHLLHWIDGKLSLAERRA